MKYEDKNVEGLSIWVAHDGKVASLRWREDVGDLLLNPYDRAKRIMKSKSESFKPEEWSGHSWSVMTYGDDSSSSGALLSAMGIPGQPDSAVTHWDVQLVKDDFKGEPPEIEVRH